MKQLKIFKVNKTTKLGVKYTKTFTISEDGEYYEIRFIKNVAVPTLEAGYNYSIRFNSEDDVSLQVKKDDLTGKENKIIWVHDFIDVIKLDKRENKYQQEMSSLLKDC